MRNDYKVKGTFGNGPFNIETKIINNKCKEITERIRNKLESLMFKIKSYKINDTKYIDIKYFKCTVENIMKSIFYYQNHCTFCFIKNVLMLV